MSERIVITGIGLVTSLGKTKHEYWDSLIKGVSGIKPISLFDTSHYESHKAGTIDNFSLSNYIDCTRIRAVDRVTQLAIASAKMASDDAKICVGKSKCDKIGIIGGVGYGTVSTNAEFHKDLLLEGPNMVSPLLFSYTTPSAACSQVAIIFGIKGPSVTISNGENSAVLALEYATNILKQKKAQVMLAGGACAFGETLFKAFLKLRLLSSENETIELSRPFDRLHNGIILGEGAGFLVLETLQHAIERNAHIYAEIAGFGNTFGNNTVSFSRSMQTAINNSGLPIDQIDHIVANANSSKNMDTIETKAIINVFKEKACKIPVSGIKSIIGETLDASGAISVISAVLAIQHGIIPPTINYSHSDPDCKLDYVQNSARKSKIKNSLINSFSCTGQNSSIILKKEKY